MGPSITRESSLWAACRCRNPVHGSRSEKLQRVWSEPTSKITDCTSLLWLEWYFLSVEFLSALFRWVSGGLQRPLYLACR